jgi:hypothetical protein
MTLETRKTSSHHPYVLGLRPGEVVRVRSPAEIFGTLDEHGTLDGLPFMPEMQKYCGRRWPVFRRADKTCAPGWGPRRMHNTVHLGNLRCDGAAHGGCQAACHMYWKEAWLERVEPGRRTSVREPDAEERDFIADTLLPATTTAGANGDKDVAYRCQATQIRHASTLIRFRRVDQYVKDVRTWGLFKVVRGVGVELFNRLQILSRRYLPSRLLIAGGRPYPFIYGKLAKTETPTARLDLVAGDMVRIKSKEEICATLDHTNHNRGLSFDTEMLKYCGRTARVRGRVERLIDEDTGKMIRIKTDCIILEGIICTSDWHLFCTRSTYPYWREIWLERAERVEFGQHR